MKSNRRDAVTMLAATGLLAACGGKANRQPVKLGRLDVGKLNAGFPTLAARAAPGRLNLGVLSVDDDHVWAADSDGRYPMADLYVLPVAAAALAEVDAGRLKLGEPIQIRDVDLSPPPSLINDAFKGSTTLPAIDLIALAVQHEDATAADVIMSRIGGPGAVGGWLQAKEVRGLRVDRYARQIATEMLGMPTFRPQWRTPAAFDDARAMVAPAEREAAVQAFLHDPQDTVTAPAALGFLDKLLDGRLLSPASTRLLLGLMARSGAAAGGLAAVVPRGATLARATADSGAGLGLTPATNEMGVATMKGGRRLAIVAFLSGSTATGAERRALIADAGRLAFHAFG